MDDLDDFRALFEPAPKCPSRDYDSTEEEVLAVLDEGRRETPKFTALSVNTDSLAPIDQAAVQLQTLAKEYGIDNVFADGGFGTLTLLAAFGLRAVPGKLGHDAVHPDGRRFELKTVNILDSNGERKNSLSVSTRTPLTLANLETLRTVDEWIVGVFCGTTPLYAYQFPTGILAAWFTEQETKIRAHGAPLNNPHIPFKVIAGNASATRHVLNASGMLPSSSPAS